jgi:hypothetical protein
MRLDAIGRVENPQDVDLDPITIPVCGLDMQRENVCEEFNFRPTLPWGNTFALIESIEGGERNLAGNTVKWLRNCLVDDEERQRWQGFLERDDVMIEQATIESVYEALAETYAARPTLPPSGSTGTGGSTKRTSQAASRSQASKSKRSRSRSVST